MRVERWLTYNRWAFSVCLVVVLVAALMPLQLQVSPTGWDKTNHVMAFAVLGTLGWRAYPQRGVPVLLALLAYGVLIELLQGLTGYRSADLFDVVADAIGLLVGWPLTRVLAKEQA